MREGHHDGDTPHAVWRAGAGLAPPGIAPARARPETITRASPGGGTDDHLQPVLLQAATGTSLAHVVFQGDPQAMAGAARSSFRPDVPTLKELGLAIEMACERGLVAPAGTPARFTEPRHEEGQAWFTCLRGLREGYLALWQRTFRAQR